MNFFFRIPDLLCCVIKNIVYNMATHTNAAETYGAEFVATHTRPCHILCVLATVQGMWHFLQ